MPENPSTGPESPADAIPEFKTDTDDARVDKLATDRLENLFSYHSPSGTQPTQYAAIREGAKAFAKIMMANTVPGADQSDALRSLRNCVMTANASVALNGKS